MIKTIKNLISLIWQDIINFIHLFNTPSSKNIEDKGLSKSLKKDGIIKIPNYIAPELCDNLKEKIYDLISGSQGNNVKINHRSKNDVNGADSGMIDIFHVDEYINLDKIINVEYLSRILQDALKQEVSFIRANAYINDSIQNTRGYHVDNFQPVIYKAFIYLSDVPDITYGPYSFIKKSHRFSGYVYLNLVKNLFQKKNQSSDMTIINTKHIENYTAPKGTLILSSQNGIHRGLPQGKGKKRIALILNFMIRSKLSYYHATARKNLKKTIANQVADSTPK